MRELQTCDFCGADPVGVYEPLPASLAGDQPRVALCAGCRDTLRRVLAPLDAADGDAGAADAARETASEPADVTTEPGSASPPEDDEPPAPDPATDEAVTIDQPAGGADATGDGADGEDDADDGGSPTAERPPGYGQVLRLVRNRDEPLERDALESLAASAYDVGAAEVRRAVDAAVENGDLQETDGGVRAP